MIPLSKESAGAGEWECMECGAIEEGAKSRRPAKCPECGAPANSLEFFSYEEEEEEWEDEEVDEEDEFDDDYAESDDLDDEWDEDDR
jgi:predicted  nucleic acid-binding Zn-ribbon protein